MKRIISILLCLLTITFVIAGCSKGDPIDWNSLLLGDRIPKPSSLTGTIISDTDEILSVEVSGITTEDYKNYISSCKETGYTIDSEQSNISYTAYNKDGYHLDLYFSQNETLLISLDAPMEMTDLNWPINELAKKLPKPNSTIGHIEWENDDEFLLYVGNTTKDDFNAYVNKCSDTGFNVDYNKGDCYYYSDNKDGYHVDLKYEGFNTMYVKFCAPKDETQDNDNTSETKATQVEEKDESKKEDLDEGIRPEFKKAMDDYESFMDEYVTFMKKYAESDGTDLSLLADYSEYITKYSDFVESFEKWEDKDLNNEELEYYLEVQNRVTQKLLEIA